MNEQGPGPQAQLGGIGAAAATRPAGAVAEFAGRLNHHNKRLAELIHCLGDHCSRTTGYNPIHDLQGDKREIEPPRQTGAMHDLNAEIDQFEGGLTLLNACIDEISKL